MSGRVLQAVTVLVVGVIGGAYTFGPLLEQQADDRQRREYDNLVNWEYCSADIAGFKGHKISDPAS